MLSMQTDVQNGYIRRSDSADVRGFGQRGIFPARKRRGSLLLSTHFSAAAGAAELDQRRGGRRPRQHHEITAMLMLIECLRIELS